MKNKLAWDMESFRKLCDEYLLPGVKAESAHLMAEHIKRYHQDGPGVNLKVGGLEFNIKEHKED